MLKYLRRSLFLITLFAVLSPVYAQNGTEPVVVSDMTRIKNLGSVAVSPDGKHVAYTVQDVVEDRERRGEYRYMTQIWLAPTDGSRPPRQITRGNTNSSGPVWHPSGDRIAFSRAADGRGQIFVLYLDGGEAEQVSFEPSGASGAKWSPDGSKLLFSASVSHENLVRSSKTLPPWDLEIPGISGMPDTSAKANPDGNLAEVRAWLRSNAGSNSPRVINRLNFLGENGLSNSWSYSHIHIMDAKPGSRGKALTSGFFSYSGANWSADGKHIFFSSNPDSTLHPDRRQGGGAIYRMNADGSDFRKFITLEGFSLGGPQVSPDGQWILFSASPAEYPGYGQSKLGIARIDGSQPRILIPEFNRSAGGAQWASDSKSVYFTASTNGGTPLYRTDLSGKITMITDTDTGIRSYSVDQNQLVYVLTTAANPFELFVARADASQPKALSTHNSSWISKKKVSIPEKFTVKRPDGLEVEYWIIKPANFQEGRKYPVVLNMHGGPSAMWGTGEASMWHEFQFFASKDYGTVFANPRGSGGYGFEFQYANFQDWGHGPAGDVLAALDEAMKLPWVDKDRLVLTGGSYAGYLTAWIVGHDHRFKAAYAQRGVYDLVTFLGEGNAWRLVPNHFGGYPWEDEIAPILRRESPLSYVDQIQTPLLIKHGDVDLRTGVIQSEMLYKSLKIQGKEVEYVRYPNGGHELSRTGNVRHRMDRMLRIWEFFERYVGN